MVLLDTARRRRSLRAFLYPSINCCSTYKILLWSLLALPHLCRLAIHRSPAPSQQFSATDAALRGRLWLRRLLTAQRRITRATPKPTGGGLDGEKWFCLNVGIVYVVQAADKWRRAMGRRRWLNFIPFCVFCCSAWALDFVSSCYCCCSSNRPYRWWWRCGAVMRI